MRKQVDSILLSTVARQVALATARQEMLDENSKFGLFVCCWLLRVPPASAEHDNCVLSRNFLSFDVWWVF